MLTPPPDFHPDFDKGGGLAAAVAQDAATGEVLMLAWMDRAAWEATLKTGEAHYFSRSRQRLWHKGETSGHVQRVRAIRLDCDSDAILLEVEQTGGAACHEGYRSCFFRRVRATDTQADPREGVRQDAPKDSPAGVRQGAVEICCPRVFDPASVYRS